MTLSPGTRFGSYEIVEPIGKGGMGEVYRATDTRLDRDVAIKTLPAALAGEADRLARFEREAKLLAALSHPHIASIYGLDEHESTLYLAMELIDGETLEEKLKTGSLPVGETLRIALQIAEALEAAHEKGVVHRDLKPANIMLTRSGEVKVLDFGLAKAFGGDPNEASPAHSPALSLAMTQQGLILGTASYMSPEQASGQATDQRADVWAFGVVLYEMLTGLPLFSGESVPHILAAVLQIEPWLDLKPSDTLDHLNAASIRYLIAVGQDAGGRTLTLKNPALARTDSTPKAFTVDQNGFSLNCSVACQAHQRDRLERLCRYITRPALCLERLSTNAAGQVVYQLKNPYRDGTTHILFSPEDFIARLAALVPRPRINLTRYHGVFAPSSPMRRAIVPTPAGVRQRRKSKDSAPAPATRQHPEEPPSDRNDPPTAPLTWAQRLKRVFEIDITLCPLCGGQLRVIADITDPDLIRRILDHVNSRAPPRLPPRRTESNQTPPDLFAER